MSMKIVEFRCRLQLSN